MPPCALSKGLKPQHAQTYVMKLLPGSDACAVQNWLNARLIDGAGAWAQVSIRSPDLKSLDLYTVLTENATHRVEGRARAFREQVAQLSGSPQTEWIHPLTRRLQRLLGWGDVASTRNVRAPGEEILESEDPYQPPSDVQCQWRQHPERPLPFFVIDQEKVHDEEKVIWIRQEIGSNATLPELCAKFIELFGDKLRGPVPQKALCLKLYAMYAPDSREAAWKKEGDLPPRDMVEFQRVWDAEAPNRCLECRKPLEGTAASFRDSSYCSDKCKRAGVVATCTRCTPEQKCRYCQSAPSGKRKYTSKLDEAIHQGEKQLDRMRQVLGHERRSVDPDHEPAWKRRRRS